jgi:hypothetical protein
MTVYTDETNNTNFNDVANQVVDRVKELIRKGNERRIVVSDKSDKVWVNTSLTIFAVAAVVLFAIFDWFAVFVAIVAAFVLKLTVNVQKVVSANDSDEVAPKAKRNASKKKVVIEDVESAS